jgi:hypothetical protein
VSDFISCGHDWVPNKKYPIFIKKRREVTRKGKIPPKKIERNMRETRDKGKKGDKWASKKASLKLFLPLAISFSFPKIVELSLGSSEIMGVWGTRVSHTFLFGGL